LGPTGRRHDGAGRLAARERRRNELNLAYHLYGKVISEDG
jgi:YD repeat-containing protein